MGRYRVRLAILGVLLLSFGVGAQTHTVLTNDQAFTIANGRALTGTYECTGGASFIGCIGSAAAYDQIQDEGSNLTKRSKLNFIGSGVSCVDNGGSTRTDCTISASGTGDVVGPGSSTDNALTRFDLTTGKLIQNSVGILSDAGALTGVTVNANVVTAGTLATARGGLNLDTSGAIDDQVIVNNGSGWQLKTLTDCQGAGKAVTYTASSNSWGCNTIGTGDVVGPGSSTDNAITRYDGTTGKLVQNSLGIIDDVGKLTGLTGQLNLFGGAGVQPPSGATPFTITNGTGAVYNVSGAGNVFNLASWVDQAGSTNAVAVFGYGRGTASGSTVWGGNFVGRSQVDGVSALGVEIDCVNITAGGSCIGLDIANYGFPTTQPFIQLISGDGSTALDGIRLAKGGGGEPLVSGGSFITTSGSPSMAYGVELNGATITAGGSAFQGPNGGTFASMNYTVSSRKADNSTDIGLVGLDSLNEIVLGSVGNPARFPDAVQLDKRAVFLEVAAPSVGSAGTAVIYADSTSHRVRYSLNGGAYDSVMTAGSTDVETNKTYDTAGSGNVFKINGTTITAISGNTATVVSKGAGSFVNGNCAKFDASGNVVDNGAACAGGGGPTGSDGDLQMKSGGSFAASNINDDGAGVFKLYPAAASPTAVTLIAAGGRGGVDSNIAGVNWQFSGSQSTGTGLGGSIIFRVANKGSSGTTANSRADTLTVAPPNSGTAAGANGVTVTGALTTVGPTIAASGSDTNIDLNLAGKGTGVVKGLTLASASFVNQGTTTTVLHGNAGGNPSFAAVAVADVAAVLKTRQAAFMIGADNGSTLTTADDQTSIFVNRLGQGIHVTEVWCDCDAGSPTIQVQKDDGSPTNMLSSDLTCSSGSGASTTTFVSGEDAIADTNRIDYLTVTASTAKRITVNVKYTLD